MSLLRMQILLILTMAGWGVNISLVKVLTEHYDVFMIATLRMSLAALVILLTLVWSRMRFSLRSITASQWLRFVACATCMVYGNQLLFVSGMSLANATNASLIMALGPLVASLLAALVFRETLTRNRLIGVALGFGGVFAVVLSGSGASVAQAGWGDLLLFLAMLSFVSGGLLIQSLARHFSSLVISAIIYVLGALMLLIHTTLFSSLQFTMHTMLPGFWPVVLLIVSGVVSTAICNMFWNRAIAELGAARTSVFQYWLPVFGVGFAVLLLNEPFTFWQVVGLAGILLGTWLGTKRPANVKTLP